LWIGTWEGLNRFDGKNFRNYYYDPDKPDNPGGNQVWCLTQDRRGMIWMGTENGMCSMAPLKENFTRFEYEKSTPDYATRHGIRSIAMDPDSHVRWAGGNGLFSVDHQDHLLIAVPGKINEELFSEEGAYITQVLPERNFLWLATSRGLFRYDLRDSTFRKVSISETVKIPGQFNHFTSIYLDEKGNLWATNWGAGLMKIDTALQQVVGAYLVDPGFLDGAHNILHDISRTNNPGESDLLWLSGISGGLFAFDRNTEKFTCFGTKDLEDSKGVYQESNDIYFSKSTGLWIGTRLGLYQYDHDQQLMKEYDPLAEDGNENKDVYFSLIYANPIDSTGKTLWLATNNKGLYTYDLATGKLTKMNQLFEPFLPEEIFVTQIFRDENQDLWIATLLNGLLKFDQRTQRTTQFEFQSEFRSGIHWINQVVRDLNEKEILWIATDHGLFRFNLQTGVSIPVPIGQDNDTFISPSIGRLSMGFDGKLWVIGYTRPDEKEFIACIKPGELSGKTIADPAGYKDPGFLDIKDLAVAPDATVFLATPRGLYYFNSAGDRPEIREFQHNLSSLGTRAEQLQPDKNGNIWALISDDLYLLDPGKLRIHEVIFENIRKIASINLNLNEITGDVMIGAWFKFYTIHGSDELLNEKPLPAFITGIRVGTDYCNGRPEDFTNKKIILPYDKNNLTIEYTAINFQAGSFNAFSYKMDGFDKNWSYTDNRSVSYKLPPGKYAFRLKAAKAGGPWDDEQVFVDIRINPPFYRTWWFASLMMLFIIALIYSIYRYRVSQLLKLQKMRDHISRDLHDDIGSSLTNIAIMNEMAIQEKRKGGDPEKILGQSAEDIHEVISSLSDIVWNVNPAYDDLKYLLARMRWYASELLENTEIIYKMEIEEPDEKISMNMAQRRDFYLIFKESLNNLVKYSNASKAEISIRIENDSVVMMISDDGNGFEPERIEFGNGLKNMKQRTEAWRGSFTLKSRPGQGTELVFIIPVKN
jgi:ligand-binding sensor domain-containing protein/two-component sensor histidine kinase